MPNIFFCPAMAPLSYPPHTLRYKNNLAPSRDGFPLTFIAIWRWSPTFVLREKHRFPFFFSKEFQEKVPNRFTYHSIAPAFGASYRPSTPEEEEGAVHIDLKEVLNNSSIDIYIKCMYICVCVFDKLDRLPFPPFVITPGLFLAVQRPLRRIVLNLNSIQNPLFSII